MSALAKKMGLKAGMRMRLVGAPVGYALSEGLPAEEGPAEFVQVFVTHAETARRVMAEVLASVEKNVLLWVTYPKKSSGVTSDLGREELRDLMSGLGWLAVTIVAVDETWSALRFRPVGDVKTERRR